MPAHPRIARACVVMAVVGLLGSCGRESGADYEGYAKYLNARVRPDDPISIAELKRNTRDHSCSPETIEDSWRLLEGTDDTVESRVADAYFLCGKSTAVEVVRSRYDGAAERGLLRLIDDELPTYSD